jgi:hypothetical protein
MQRISFDFMARRIRATATSLRSRLIHRDDSKDDLATKIAREKEQEKIRRFYHVETMRYWFRGIRPDRNFKDTKISRPARRYYIRCQRFEEVTKRFPSMPRSIRRKIVFDSIRNKTALKLA